MATLNALLARIFDVLLAPFSGLHPLVGLTLISFLATVLILPIIKWTTDQDHMEAVKRRIKASLFEIRLFNDNALAIIRAFFDILRHNAAYMWVWRGTLFVLIAILLPIIAHLQFHYGYRGLQPGDTTLFEVDLNASYQETDKPNAELRVPEGLRLETPAVWVSPLDSNLDGEPRDGQLTWRLAAEEPGDYDVELVLNGESFVKKVQVSDKIARRSPVRPEPTFMAQLLYPAEAPMPAAGPIRQIEIKYPPADGGIGWDIEIAWMVTFFLLTIVFALALKKPMGVEF